MALESVYNAFVEIIESNAVALLFMRDIKTGNPIYSTLLELYRVWQKKIIKSPFIIKSLEKYEFIAKKQREDFYETRKEKFGF